MPGGGGGSFLRQIDRVSQGHGGFGTVGSGLQIFSTEGGNMNESIRFSWGSWSIRFWRGRLYREPISSRRPHLDSSRKRVRSQGGPGRGSEKVIRPCRTNTHKKCRFCPAK